MREKFTTFKETINYKLWKYFVAFAATILIILWLLQIVFLNSFYEGMKQREIIKIGNSLRSEFASDDFEYILYNHAIQKGITISVINDKGNIIYPVSYLEILLRPQISEFEDENFREIFDRVKEGLPYDITVMKYDRIESKVLCYVGDLGQKFNDHYYLFITSALEPVDATTGVLQNILFLVSIISLFIGLILSYFLSNRFSKPLIDMSNTAKELEKGNLDVVFKKGDYAEIDNLAEALNRATDELAKTVEMRKDLIANVSHDLKTPLTVIKSYGEMIRDISGDDPKKREAHINTIIEEADNLTDFVNDLLDLSKFESGMEMLKLEEYDLKEIAREVVDRFKLSKEKDGYSFIIESEGNTNIVCDKNQISQVIYNWLSNAVSYTLDNKEIRVKITGTDDTVELHVIDKGIGIDESQLQTIWNRFFRVRDNHHRSSVGTGLGLYIVKSILELHGFEYGVNSILGKGSDFYFIYQR